MSETKLLLSPSVYVILSVSLCRHQMIMKETVLNALTAPPKKRKKMEPASGNIHHLLYFANIQAHSTHSKLAILSVTFKLWLN